MGCSQHAGVVIICDGTEAAAKRIERVLFNDPATGVICRIRIAAIGGTLFKRRQTLAGIGPSSGRSIEARANQSLNQPVATPVERREFFQGIGAVRNKEVSGAGLLLFGTDTMLRELWLQHQVQYILQSSPLARNDFLTGGLLSVLERIDHAFEGPTNPEQELSLGLLKLRIPRFSSHACLSPHLRRSDPAPRWNVEGADASFPRCRLGTPTLPIPNAGGSPTR